MRWGKFILVFQAVVTLVIGIVFFLQVFNIQYNLEDELKERTNGTTDVVAQEIAYYQLLKDRFFTASYIVVVISLIEIIILWRLFDHT